MCFVSGRKIHYKDSVFYELIPGWVVAGGDFINNNGTAGESAINGTVFKDENFSISHDRPGIISMLGHGPNTNSSLVRFTLFIKLLLSLSMLFDF